MLLARKEQRMGVEWSFTNYFACFFECSPTERYIKIRAGKWWFLISMAGRVRYSLPRWFRHWRVRCGRLKFFISLSLPRLCTSRWPHSTCILLGKRIPELLCCSTSGCRRCSIGEAQSQAGAPTGPGRGSGLWRWCPPTPTNTWKGCWFVDPQVSSWLDFEGCSSLLYRKKSRWMTHCSIFSSVLY